MEGWDKIAELVINAQRGDNEAIGRIYNKCVGYVYKRARYMLRTDEDAQDVTQDVFVDVIKSLDTLKEPKAFMGWLNKIILYKCYRYYDKSEYKVVNASLDENMDNDVDFIDDNDESMPADVFEKSETRDALQAIIDSLPKVQGM